MNKVPDRWLDYCAIGKVVAKTRFIAFKVPLKPALLRKVSDERHLFNLDMLFKEVERQDSSLGLVVDLTNTDRYYDKNDLLKKGSEYKKIYTKGHEIPDRAVLASFFDVVDEFLERNTDKKSLIGVHCTHGVNRTGYLLCRYMRDRLGFQADEAIEAFSKARGHSIERKNYIDNLRSNQTDDAANNYEESYIAANCNDANGNFHTMNSMNNDFHKNRNDNSHASFSNTDFYNGIYANNGCNNPQGNINNNYPHNNDGNNQRSSHNYFNNNNGFNHNIRHNNFNNNNGFNHNIRHNNFNNNRQNTFYDDNSNNRPSTRNSVRQYNGRSMNMLGNRNNHWSSPYGHPHHNTRLNSSNNYDWRSNNNFIKNK